jgi:hypothetical protein
MSLRGGMFTLILIPWDNPPEAISFYFTRTRQDAKDRRDAYSTSMFGVHCSLFTVANPPGVNILSLFIN